MRRLRVRFSVRSIMIVVVLIAFASALVVQSVRIERRNRDLSRLRQLLSDYQRAADRMHWAERMYKKGYVSKAQLDTEKVSLERMEMLLSSNK
jgi:hypothetical protein